jgi:hypothetical protein
MLSTVRQADGYAAGAPETGTASYGLRAVNEYRILLARWNANGIRYFSGRPIPVKNSLTTFGAAK